MSENQKVKFKWLEKIKNVKHIEIIIIVIFAIVIFLIYSSTLKPKSSSSSTTKSETNELTINSYVDDLEKNLENTLSKIKGVDDVNVMISLDLSEATVEDNIIKSSTFPKIKGIVVVAKGVENTNVKLTVLKAIQAVVEINNGCIEILSSN